MTLQTVSINFPREVEFVEVVRFLSIYDRVFFVHYLDEEKDSFGVSDLRTGFLAIIFADSERDAISQAQFRLREKNAKVKYQNYEKQFGVFEKNLDDFEVLNLVEKNGFWVCPCAMECLEDAAICRHGKLPY